MRNRTGVDGMTWDASGEPKGFAEKGSRGLDTARTFVMRGGSDNTADEDDRRRGDNNTGPRHS